MAESGAAESGAGGRGRPQKKSNVGRQYYPEGVRRLLPVMSSLCFAQPRAVDDEPGVPGQGQE